MPNIVGTRHVASVSQGENALSSSQTANTLLDHTPSAPVQNSQEAKVSTSPVGGRDMSRPYSSRHQFRATWHDYNEGLYFVTVCCAEHKCFFGKIKEYEMHHTPLGRCAEAAVAGIPDHYPYACVHASVVMPNHLHMMLEISPEDGVSRLNYDGNDRTGCLSRPEQCCFDLHHNSNLSKIIGGMKASVTRYARKSALNFAWQPRFHEHIVRDQKSYYEIMEYIWNNPLYWIKDKYHV